MTLLFPYQAIGARFLAEKKRALLADEPGLGKSAQAIAACDALRAQRVIVICPASLVENWCREFSRFSTRPTRLFKMNTKTAAKVFDTFVGLGDLDDHEGSDGFQEAQDVHGLVKSPSPLRLNALDRAASQRPVEPVIDPAAGLSEEINHVLVGAGEGHSPGDGVLVSGVHSYPTLSVDDACHVGQGERVIGHLETSDAFSSDPHAGTEHLLVAPTKCGLADRQVGDDRSQLSASGKTIQRDAEVRVGNSRVSGQVHVLVVSYDTFVRVAEMSESVRYDTAIVDESHFLKTRTAKRTKAIFGEKCDGVGGLVERARHVFLLTGTPTPNNPAELWPMLRAVMPGAIVGKEKPLAYWPFINRYCKLRDKGFGVEIVGGKNLAELRERIAPFVLRRKKSEVLKDLPPIRFDTLALEGRVETTPETEDAMIAVAEALAEGGVEGLAKIAPHVATLRRLTGLAKAASAMDWIRDWLDGGGKKLVVFAHHTDVLSGLVLGLGEHSPAVVSGATHIVQRQLEVDKFQTNSNCRVFIGQIQAAGTGITLHAASDVLFVESSWVPADNEQAAMRVHRIGQANACLVRYAMLAGSIDENIQRALVRKSSDTAALWG